jgi:hypothetical protein
LIMFNNFMRNALQSAGDIAGIHNCCHFDSLPASLDGFLKGLQEGR